MIVRKLKHRALMALGQFHDEVHGQHALHAV